MSVSNLQEVERLLVGYGISLAVEGEALVLSDGDRTVRLRLGVWMFAFMLNWIRPLLSGASPTPDVMAVAFSHHGVKNFYSCDLTDDEVVWRMFCSKRVLDRSSASSTERRTCYPFRVREPLVTTDLFCLDFYAARNQPFQACFDTGLNELLPSWADVVKEKGWSWNCHGGITFLGNTVSSSFGIPPTHDQVGLKPILAEFKRELPMTRCGALNVEGGRIRHHLIHAYHPFVTVPGLATFSQLLKVAQVTNCKSSKRLEKGRTNLLDRLGTFGTYPEYCKLLQEFVQRFKIFNIRVMLAGAVATDGGVLYV